MRLILTHLSALILMLGETVILLAIGFRLVIWRYGSGVGVVVGGIVPWLIAVMAGLYLGNLWLIRHFAR